MNESLILKLKPVVLKTAEGFEFFDFEEIIYFEADRNNTLVYIINRNKHIRVLCNLSTIEKQNQNPTFFRCHRSYIVNLSFIRKMSEKSSFLTVIQDISIPISTDKRKEIKKAISQSQN